MIVRENVHNFQRCSCYSILRGIKLYSEALTYWSVILNHTFHIHIYTLIVPTSKYVLPHYNPGHCILVIIIIVCFLPIICCFTVPVHLLYFTVSPGFNTMVSRFYSPIVYSRYDRFCFTMLFTYCVFWL
jgi:hypothetical protein